MCDIRHSGKIQVGWLITLVIAIVVLVLSCTPPTIIKQNRVYYQWSVITKGGDTIPDEVIYYDWDSMVAGGVWLIDNGGIVGMILNRKQDGNE